MNRPCPQRQDKIADYVLEVLDAQEAHALREHLAGCDACRQYARSLQGQAGALVALGSQLDARMKAREDRVIETLEATSPAEACPRRTSLFISLLRTAAAAVLVLGTGIGIGRWTAPRAVDVEQLRADLQAALATSVAGTVQESILSQVDQRLQGGLSKNEERLRTELASQVRDNVQRVASQAAATSDTLMEKRFTELIQLVEEARLKDRRQVVKALEQIERSHYRDRTRIQTSLAALIEKRPAPVP